MDFVDLFSTIFIVLVAFFVGLYILSKFYELAKKPLQEIKRLFQGLLKHNRKGGCAK